MAFKEHWVDGKLVIEFELQGVIARNAEEAKAQIRQELIDYYHLDSHGEKFTSPDSIKIELSAGEFDDDDYEDCNHEYEVVVEKNAYGRREFKCIKCNEHEEES